MSKRHLRRKVANNVKLTLFKSCNLDVDNQRSHEIQDRPNLLNLTKISTVKPSVEPVATETATYVDYDVNCSSNNLFSKTDLFMLRGLITVDNSPVGESVNPLVVETTESSSNEKSFLEPFRKWIFDNNITHKAINELIQIIHPAFPFLKRDARTILKTPRKVTKSQLGNGKMIYFGIEQGLRKQINEGFKHANELISLKINVDGIPLFKSSSIEFWPILAHSDCFKNPYPFAVAIFCGTGKPSPIEDFLKRFIEEYLSVFSNGIIHLDKKYKVEIKFFSCDAPARSYLKCVVGHTSKIGCERCLIKADREDYKNFYPVDSVHEARTDSDFLIDGLESNSYIKGKSPLLALEVGLVSQFVLDPMHLIYQGIMRRLLLLYWIEGKRPYKISKLSISKISNLLLLVKKHTPVDFHRKIRPLNDVKRWKALEFRFFLLYCGPLVLKNILEEEYYQHFLLLHCAVFIFNNEYLLNKYFLVAKEAIDKFVRCCPRLYDKFFVTYNVHSLNHLHEDVARYGQLENFSCFGFENYLGKLKSRIRGKTLPLEQIYNRLSEMESFAIDTKTNPDNYCPMFVKHISSSYFTCNKLKFNNILISISPPNNVVAVNKKIYVIKTIFHLNGIYKIICTAFKYLKDIYTKPIKSSKLGVYFARGKSNQVFFHVAEISCKYIAIPYKNGFYVSPIIHQKSI